MKVTTIRQKVVIPASPIEVYEAFIDAIDRSFLYHHIDVTTKLADISSFLVIIGAKFKECELSGSISCNTSFGKLLFRVALRNHRRLSFCAR